MCAQVSLQTEGHVATRFQLCNWRMMYLSSKPNGVHLIVGVTLRSSKLAYFGITQASLLLSFNPQAYLYTRDEYHINARPLVAESTDAGNKQSKTHYFVVGVKLRCQQQME